MCVVVPSHLQNTHRIGDVDEEWNYIVVFAHKECHEMHMQVHAFNDQRLILALERLQHTLEMVDHHVALLLVPLDHLSNTGLVGHAALRECTRRTFLE